MTDTTTDTPTVTIDTYQRGLRSKRGPWVEALELSTPARYIRAGKMLSEEITRLPDGQNLHTIAVRWQGEGITVYQVERTRPHFADTGYSWDVVPLHVGL